jgi:hypothetical protein
MATQATKSETPTPSGGGSAILGTRGGENYYLRSLKTDEPSEDKESSGGRIFTTADMPALEELLDQLKVVTAIIEKPVPVMVKGAERSDTEHSDPRRAGFARMVILGGFPAATLTAGIVMMVGAMAGASAVSNPYLALYLILAGIGLGITSWAALREARRA